MTKPWLEVRVVMTYIIRDAPSHVASTGWARVNPIRSSPFRSGLSFVAAAQGAFEAAPCRNIEYPHPPEP